MAVCVLLAGGDEEKDFYIQKNTGTISIARRLDAARRSVYNMTVHVTDGHQNATTQVRNTERAKNLLHMLKKENRDMKTTESQDGNDHQ